MDRRQFIIVASASAVTLAGCAALGGPGNRPVAATPIPRDQHDATIELMRPPKRERPVVAVLADHRGSETTDFIVPWSVLTRSGDCEVKTVGTQSGPIQLIPALKIDVELATTDFDEQFPAGADYVIVPAFHDPKSSAALAWIKSQAERGATIIGICAGALPMAHAGVLSNKRATTHWFDRTTLLRASPTTTVVKDRRYVADAGVITSTGVSASLPLALALVEAIAGSHKAEALAESLSVQHYDARHVSDNYKLRAQTALRAAVNWSAFVGHEKIAGEVSETTDELSLAFEADAWSRTYRSMYRTYSASEAIHTKHGLRVYRDVTPKQASTFIAAPRMIQPPGQRLMEVIDHIAERYGRPTASLVALQLEYPWPV